MAHTPGRFVWRERVSPDVEQAKGFYSAMFGWTWEEMRGADGPYVVGHAAGAPVGGLWQPPAGRQMPAAWMSYVSVDDVDLTTDRAQHLGWSVGRPPTEIEGVGRFSVLNDFAGAWILPFHSANGDPPPAEPPEGAFCWESLITSDVGRALAEYGALLGWKQQSSPNGEVPILAVDDTPRGQVADVQQAAGRPPCWLTYVRVADAPGLAARAGLHGGRVLVPRIDIPEVGTIAFLADPGGAVLGLFQPA